MELLSSRIQQLVDYLNTGCDDSTNEFIGRSFFKLPTLSVIYPVLDRNRPWICLFDLFRLGLYSSIIILFLYLGSLFAIELSKISFVLSLNLIHILIVLMMSIGVLWHSWLRRANISALNTIIAGNFFDYGEDLSGIWDKLEEEVAAMRRWCLQSVMLIGFAGAMAIIVAPILNTSAGAFNYDSIVADINFDLPVPSSYPFNSETGTLEFYLEYATEVICGCLTVLILCSKCLMLIDNILPLHMHQKLLVIQFENIETRALDLYRRLSGNQLNDKKGKELYSDNTFSECLKVCLNKNIRHHQIILRAKNELNKVYGFYTFLYYVISSVAIAMGVLCASSTAEFPGTTVSSVILCLVETFFVALYSHFGQTLINLNADLREKIYSTQWYHFRKDLKKTINIVQTMTAQPFTFCYSSVLRVDYDSFATVLNTSYSFYNIVNASK